MKEDTTEEEEEEEEATKKVRFHTRVGNGSVCGEKSRARKSFPCSNRVNIFAPFFDVVTGVTTATISPVVCSVNYWREEGTEKGKFSDPDLGGQTNKNWAKFFPWYILGPSF